MPVQIEAGKLGARIRSDANGMPGVLQRAMFSAGQRGKAYLVGKSPVDRGILKNAWRVVKLSDGVEIVNDQPYAGVMELGARPFKIGRAGMEALTAWVLRKLLSGVFKTRTNAPVKLYKNQHGTWKGRKKTNELEKEAQSIAWAIAKTFEKNGIKGKRFVYLNLYKLAAIMDEEVTRYIDKYLNRGS